MGNPHLDALAGSFWEHYLETNPTEAHLLGDYRFAGRWEDESRDAEDAVISALREFAARAQAIDPAGLEDQERLTRAVLVETCTSLADVRETRPAEIGCDPIFGPQVVVPIVLGMLALPTVEVAEAMGEKLRGIATSYRDLVERLRDGLADDRTPAAFAVRGVVEQLDAQLSVPAAESSIVAALPEPPEGVDAEAWRARMAGSSSPTCAPPWAATATCCATRCSPTPDPTRSAVSGAVPGGRAAYGAMLRYSTTTTKTAQEIHDLGLARSPSWPTSTAHSAPRWSAPTTSTRSSTRCAPTPPCTSPRASSSSRPPRSRWRAPGRPCPTGSRCSPRPPAPSRAPRAAPRPSTSRRPPTAAAAAPSSSTSTTRRSWGTFELESMAFHEGIPGHHLQLTIAAELDGVPEFRKHLHNNAYAEGWGLYTERLADEMGLYARPVDRMGMYAADSMRACRLVVDTGLHALGWSREQAVQYMVDNSPLADAMVRPEIDRYITNPGPGDRLHGRAGGDRADPRRGGGAPGLVVRRQGVPLGGARLGLAAAQRARRRSSPRACRSPSSGLFSASSRASSRASPLRLEAPGHGCDERPGGHALGRSPGPG